MDILYCAGRGSAHFRFGTFADTSPSRFRQPARLVEPVTQ